MHARKQASTHAIHTRTHIHKHMYDIHTHEHMLAGTYISTNSIYVYTHTYKNRELYSLKHVFKYVYNPGFPNIEIKLIIEELSMRALQSDKIVQLVYLMT